MPGSNSMPHDHAFDSRHSDYDLEPNHDMSDPQPSPAITLPENIDELIAEYFRQQSARFKPEHKAHLMISCGYRWELSAGAYPWDDHNNSFTGATLADAADKLAEHFVNHDPIKEKREKAAKLLREAEELERGMQ